MKFKPQDIAFSETNKGKNPAVKTAPGVREGVSTTSAKGVSKGKQNLSNAWEE